MVIGHSCDVVSLTRFPDRKTTEFPYGPQKSGSKNKVVILN